MIAEKLAHHYPGAGWNWPREGDYDTLQWAGRGDKPALAGALGLTDQQPASRRANWGCANLVQLFIADKSDCFDIFHPILGEILVQNLYTLIIRGFRVLLASELQIGGERPG